MISGNTITEGAGQSGRGILLDEANGNGTPCSDGEVYDNYVDIQERPDPEYGADGLQVTALRIRDESSQPDTNLSIHDNTFIAQTGPAEVWGAKGLVLTFESNPQGIDLNDVIENNTIEAIVNTTDPDYYADAVALEDVGTNCSPCSSTTSSRATTSPWNSGMAMDGPNWTVISSPTPSVNPATAPKCRTPPSRRATGSVGCRTCRSSIPAMPPAPARPSLGQLALPCRRLQPHVDFGWLLTVEADDANGDALSGATVNVFDNSGSQVFSGVTDASGQLVGIPLVTTIYQQSGDRSERVLYHITTQNCGPFQVQVSLAGYATTTQAINLTQSTTAQFQLSSGTMATVNAPRNLSATAAASPASVSLSWTDNAANATVLHGGAVGRHDGRLDRHRQRPCRHGHQLHGQQRDGSGELQL